MNRPATRSDILTAMGIAQWRLRNRESGPDVAATPDAEVASPNLESDATLYDWPELQQRVAACTACNRHQYRSHAVFGSGANPANCLIVADSPTNEDDASGAPFSDRSGVLLDAMLRAIGLQRDQVFITQSLKCQGAPEEDHPEPTDLAACSSHLENQIALLRPNLIIALGLTAARSLLDIKPDSTVGELREQQHQHAASGAPVLVTYHPRYLLRRPGAKAAAWADLLKIQRLLQDARR